MRSTLQVSVGGKESKEARPAHFAVRSPLSRSISRDWGDAAANAEECDLVEEAGPIYGLVSRKPGAIDGATCYGPPESRSPSSLVFDRESSSTYLIIFACILLAPLLLQGSLSDPLGSGGDLLQESFLQQQASINGQSIPAANIRVLHRWRTHMMCERTGKIMEIDANWLCRTVDG